MFDTEDWNVDGEAVHLASSLFDPVTPTHPRRKKKKSRHSDPNLTDTSDKKSPVKKRQADESNLNMKKKKNRRSDTKSTEVAPGEVESGKQNLCVSGSKKKKILQSPIKGAAVSSEEYITKKKKKKQNVSTSQENVPKSHQSDKSQPDKQKKLKRKKISREIEKDDESPFKKLKVQEMHGQDERRAEEDNLMTRKERRHKHKKKTSKKNKYKHLADARKNSNGTDGSTGSIPAVSQDSVVKGQFVLLRKNTGDSGETLPNSEQFLDKKKKKESKKSVTNSDRPCLEEKNSVKENVSVLKNKRGTDFDTKKPKINSKSESDVSLKVTKFKTPKKHTFDLEKLKEMISANEKQNVKKTSSGNGQKEKKKSLDYIGKPVKKKKSIMESISNDRGDTANHPLKVKSPTKRKFDVNKLKEIMSSEKKKMDTLKQDLEKKERKRDSNQGKSLTDRMHERLAAARFRYLNEQLYTTTGNEAAQLFADDEEAFHVYHEGYSSQVSKWPIDPLDIIIKEINIRHRTPKTVIADMGCGSARLAQSISGVKVHSFDLVSVNERVTACDMSKVPLDTGCVDVVVFCLSLMGTNLTDYLLEANRILKKGGVMMIAEVESRFQKVGAFISKVEKLGFEIVSKDTSNKMFCMFHFKKVHDMKETPLNLCIELDPCIYKKR
ncbi:ribosomal RNA-processing protein 8-like [Haliotis asinina]|uniref:ribosomal RNA-processing protein 8-like n=1 Tax=Haliotis asinina TaxID=109174 RepID=UPI0035326A91